MDGCPKCKSELIAEPDCPTYLRNGVRYRCSPTCGNAWEYFCTNNDCGWSYITDLPTHHPDYVENEKKAPANFA